MSHTLLLVDDEDDIREVAQLSLEMTAGWEVHTASSGAQALAAARALKPEAILMDVMMPEMDGPTTVRHLKADPETAGIPVILLTAKVQASDRAAFEGLGVAGVLAKPFDPMALADEVAAVLGW
ncbi:MAG TPA: response regulator [Longimicrobium sp.]|jgi:CheY-like chemotaxis protein|uniref:response regulator n=1 Tax=Longimicrobium sp. TaxID=2029185 RepID=UPI002EDB78D9